MSTNDEPRSQIDVLSEEHGERSSDHRSVLQNLYSGRISAQLAAESLASLALEDDNLENGLRMIWSFIEWDARERPAHHQILAELMAAITSQPPALDNQGDQLKIYGARVWDDLPMFGWDMYETWQCLGMPDSAIDEPVRKEAITTFLNFNTFAAHLRCTQNPALAGYDWWALVVMREALEQPQFNPEMHDPEALFPAAMTWLSILGQEMYSWDKEFPYGGNLGDPGGGGPLWNGQHGFCKERWNLWKQRFFELSSLSELSEDVKALCREGAAKMIQVESQAGTVLRY